MSDPQFDGLHSLRFTDASVIPLIFNARSYVEVLWDQDGDQQIDTDVAVYIEIITGPSEVTLRLPNGDTTIAKSGEITPISHEALHENDKGLLEIQILNPNHELVGIDLIALGLSQVP